MGKNQDKSFKTRDSYYQLPIFSCLSQNKKECHQIFSIKYKRGCNIKNSIVIDLIKQSVAKQKGFNYFTSSTC